MSRCVLYTPKTFDVGLGNSTEYGIAVVRSRADDGSRGSARRILVDEWADVSQSSHVVIASTNNTGDVHVERKVSV